MLKNGYPVEEFNRIIRGDFLQNTGQKFIKHIVTDSRKFEVREGSVFFAIKGSRSNGHAYLGDMYNRGVRLFVVNKSETIIGLKNATIISVENTVSALQNFATYHRGVFKFPVIGVTGSNGKTTVKEWAYQLLFSDYHIVRSPKSYNSQIGVPLSVLLIDETHDIAVFEAGISQKGEMERLQKMIQPTIGIFTNIGQAHQENFQSLESKVVEKLILFSNCTILIYCKDHSIIESEIKVNFNSARPKLLTWSAQGKAADLEITEIATLKNQTKLKANYKNKVREIEIPFHSVAEIENASHLWLLLLYLEISDEVIAERFSSLTPVAMRLEQLNGINGCVLINDVYNSDINSLAIALDYLKFQSKNKKYTAIVSDILQSGEDEKVLYKRVADLLNSRKINRFIGIGSHLKKNAWLFDGVKASFYETTTAFLQEIHKRNFSRENILLKGARPFQFERIADFLQEKSHETVLEIDLTRMVENLNYIRSILKPKTKLMAMVKAFAYGAGSYDVARILEYNRIDYLAVAYADEGISLRADGITTRIMVLNPEISSYDAMIRYRLEPQIFSFRTLRYFARALAGTTESRPYPVHIKINTGMNRLGFEPQDMTQLAKELNEINMLDVKSAFSHLAGSDEETYDSITSTQIDSFSKAADELQSKIATSFMRHILNSNGMLRHPDAQMDMVRLGLGLYGLTTSTAYRQKLKPVSRLKTVISQIREVNAGGGIGYSPKSKLTEKTKIAVIPVGYADGLPRLLGNGGGNVLISNTPVPFIGNICMDMCMVNVTGVECEEGDEVEVFGDNLDIYEMAEHLKTIPYEVLTNISQRVKRVFIQD